MIQKSVIETLIGGLVLIAAILFVVIVYRSGNIGIDYDAVYTIKAAFERADGIEIDSDVSISGVHVGKVSEKKLDNNTYSAFIIMKIDKKVSLPTDTSAEIASTSLLGEKYIALIPGANSEMLKDNDVIEFTQSSISLESLIGKLMFGFESKRNKNDSQSSQEFNDIRDNGYSFNNTTNNSTNKDTTITEDITDDFEDYDHTDNTLKNNNQNSVSNENTNNDKMFEEGTSVFG